MRARMVVAMLALVGALVALYLTLYKFGVIGQLACTTGGCERVQTSRWSMLFGLPIATWGLGTYLVLLALALLGLQPAYAESRAISWALVFLSGWGVLFSGWLTYLELHVIHAICQYCVVSAILITLVFIASLIDLRGRAPSIIEHG